MKTSTEGYQQCYNAQAAMDGESQLVVGTAVTACASDQGWLTEMLDVVDEVCGETPGEVLADAGYCGEEELAELEARGIDGYVALGREGKASAGIDPESCPAKARMAQKLAAPAGRAVYAKRKWIAEAPIGWIKGGDGVPAVQPPGPGERAGRVGPRVPGAQRAADARPAGGVRGEIFAPGALRDPKRARIPAETAAGGRPHRCDGAPRPKPGTLVSPRPIFAGPGSPSPRSYRARS